MDGEQGDDSVEDELPDELWLGIFAFLSDTHLLACSLVCARWHLLTQDARILCDKKFYGKVKKSTLMATQNSYKALFYKKSLIENRNWMQDAALYTSLLDETGESAPKTRTKKSKKKKKKPALVLINDQLNMSSIKFNDKYLVAGTSLPDSGIEEIQNLMIEKTIGVWGRNALNSSLAVSRALIDDEEEAKDKGEKSKGVSPDSVLRGHHNSITCIMLGNTETTNSIMLSASSDTTVRVWDLDTGGCTSVLAAHKQSVYCLAWQQEAGVVFSGSKDKTIKVWNLQSERVMMDISDKKDIHKRAVVAMDLLPHLNCLATGGLDRSLKLWDIETGLCVKTEKKVHRGWVSCVRGGPHYLMCTAGDTKIKVWDTRTVDSVATIRKMKKAHRMGDYVATLQFDQNKVITGTMTGRVAVHDIVSDLQYDDSLLATASSDKKVKIWLFEEPREGDEREAGKCLLA